MTNTERDILLRHLHERNRMSPQERLYAEWKLLTSAAHRDAYREMERMHRRLRFHFASGATAVGLPSPPFPWLRIGFWGILGALAVASSLLWMQEKRLGNSARAATAATALSACPVCHRAVGQCPHCAHALPSAQVRCTK